MKKKVVIAISLLVVFGLLDKVFHLGEGLPVFTAALGLAGGFLLFVLAKLFVSPLLNRNEDYYESGRNNK
ncbi:MAG: hypothetical protein PHW65_03145 [Dehalococcoidales bacterium]|jgi:hypothetical protein|nr:hypothetical protein [Dehalococcoidales bacterium]